MIMFALGAAMFVGGFGGAIVLSKAGGPPTEKDILHTCFNRARLYLKNKVDDKWVYTYPVVNGHETFDDREEHSFTLPIGLDPERVTKFYWVFKQGFGEHVDLVGDTSSFTLRVYNKGIEKFNYNLSDIPLNGYHLPIIAGCSREGWEIIEMVENPHLLIAGETGSGKSTALRAILSTLILHMKPSDIELYLADLKRSEFHLFRGIQHVKSVVNDRPGLSKVLDTIAAELVTRGDLCDKHEVSNIIDLPFKIPFIILAIDEVALLKKDKKLMPIIEDIAATGRALGVFLILSMQRPDSKLLESGLKSNLTVRMAFKHEDATNSRITLDCAGAEKIETKGLMLLKCEGIKNVQSPFLTLPEAKRLLKK